MQLRLLRTVNRKADLPKYTVRPEKQDGPLRTLHRDLLPAVAKEPQSRPSTCLHPNLHVDGREPDFDSDDENETQILFFQDPSLRTAKFTRELEMIMPPRQEQNCSDEAIPDSAPEELTETSPECDTLPERDNICELKIQPEIDQSDNENLPGLDLETKCDRPEEENLLRQMSDESRYGTELRTAAAEVGNSPEIQDKGNERCHESEVVRRDVAPHLETNVNEADTNECEVDTSAERRS